MVPPLKCMKHVGVEISLPQAAKQIFNGREVLQGLS